MKRSKYKTTFSDVLAFLELNGPDTSENIGAHFWPDKVGYGPARGGPCSVAVSASWLLAKMERRGFVYHDLHDNWHRWSITNAGREYLQTNQQESPNV